MGFLPKDIIPACENMAVIEIKALMEIIPDIMLLLFFSRR